MADKYWYSDSQLSSAWDEGVNPTRQTHATMSIAQARASMDELGTRHQFDKSTWNQALLNWPIEAANELMEEISKRYIANVAEFSAQFDKKSLMPGSILGLGVPQGGVSFLPKSEVVAAYTKHTVAIGKRPRAEFFMRMDATYICTIACVSCGSVRSYNPYPLPFQYAPQFSGKLWFNTFKDAVKTKVSIKLLDLGTGTEWAAVAGICAGCKAQCSNCNRVVSLDYDQQELLMLQTENICPVCNKGSLVLFQPPKPNRSELRGFVKKFGGIRGE